MKYYSKFLLILLSLVPVASVYGLEQNIGSNNDDFKRDGLSLIAEYIDNKKTAEEYLDKAKTLIIDDYTPLLQKNKKQREEFIGLVNKSLEINKTARGYLFLGHADFMAFNSLGYKNAVANYEKAIELNPEYVEAFISLGALHQNNKNYEGVITNYGEAIRLDSSNELLYEEIGTAKRELGDHKGAIIDFKKAININPRNARTYFYSGQSKHFLGDFKGAVNDFSKAIDLNPENANFYFFRAFVYFDQDDITNGCKDLENASRQGANTANAFKKHCKS